jgi:hypothetical protein
MGRASRDVLSKGSVMISEESPDAGIHDFHDDCHLVGYRKQSHLYENLQSALES